MLIWGNFLCLSNEKAGQTCTPGISEIHHVRDGAVPVLVNMLTRLLSGVLVSRSGPQWRYSAALIQRLQTSARGAGNKTLTSVPSLQTFLGIEGHEGGTEDN